MVRDEILRSHPTGVRLPARFKIQPFLKRVLLEESVIDVMPANPKPHVLVGQLDSQGAVFQRHPRRPDFLEQQLRLANSGAMGEEAVQPRRAHFGGTMPEFCEPFRQRATYENLMEMPSDLAAMSR